MRKLHKLLVLEPKKRSLVIRAALFLCLAKVSLVFLPFRFVRRFLNFLSPSPVSGASRNPSVCSEIGWAVAAAGWVIPGGRSCLPQALTAEMLLRWHGFPVRLQIGVACNEEEKFQAHAWVESAGQVVIGGSALTSFTPLVAFEGTSS